MTGTKAPKQLILVTGGAGSGKSALAQSLAGKFGRQVTFLATAEAGDEEMALRIAQHRRERPGHWRTVELPVGVAAALRNDPGEVVVLDCLALLVSNLFLLDEEFDSAAARVEVEISELLAAYEEGSFTLVVVTNEVGLGVVPAYPLGRAYRDLLGRANAVLAAAADKVYWLVSGLALEIKASGLAAPWEKVHVHP